MGQWSPEEVKQLIAALDLHETFSSSHGVASMTDSLQPGPGATLKAGSMLNTYLRGQEKTKSNDERFRAKRPEWRRKASINNDAMHHLYELLPCGKRESLMGKGYDMVTVFASTSIL